MYWLGYKEANFTKDLFCVPQHRMPKDNWMKFKVANMIIKSCDSIAYIKNIVTLKKLASEYVFRYSITD